MKRAGNPKSDTERIILPRYIWPEADRLGWEKDVCRPSVRLKKGGSGSHLAPESAGTTTDARRYGRFLGFLQRTSQLHMNAPAASQVTPTNADVYMADFDGKIRSVTAWNCIYKLRRAAQLLSASNRFYVAHRDRERS